VSYTLTFVVDLKLEGIWYGLISGTLFIFVVQQYMLSYNFDWEEIVTK
jgi:hypothetical protein